MPAQNLDQAALLAAAVDEGLSAFKAAVAKYRGERFYAFCFYTDNDVTSVYPTAATLEGFERVCPTDAAPQDRLYYRWAPAEWDLDFGQHASARFMTLTNRLMYPAADEPDEPPGAFGARKRRTLATLTAALLEIRAVGVFATVATSSRIACWVNIGDAIEGEIEWMFEPAIVHLEPRDRADLRALFEFKCVEPPGS
jgi:hypothetical protein